MEENSQVHFLRHPFRLIANCPRTCSFPNRVACRPKDVFGHERLVILIWAKNKNLVSLAEAEIFPKAVPAVEMVSFKTSNLNKN